MVYQSLSQIGDVLTQADGNYWCKNPTGEYFGVGKAFVALAGLNSANDIIGKTDYQLPWASSASIIEQNDKEVMHKHPKIEEESIEVVNHQTILFLVAKFPYFNSKQQLLGTVGVAKPLTKDIQHLSSELAKTLTSQDTAISPILALSNELFATLDSYTVSQKYYVQGQKHFLKINSGYVGFSQRELYCLGFLILGKSAKETAQRLNISPKTVEYYLHCIKNKLKCYHRSQLIALLFKHKLVNQLVQMIEDL